ncbi:Hypothetical protein FKW44_019399, partial [Caligus rogercresseyi]
MKNMSPSGGASYDPNYDNKRSPPTPYDSRRSKRAATMPGPYDPYEAASLST